MSWDISKHEISIHYLAVAQVIHPEILFPGQINLELFCRCSHSLTGGVPDICDDSKQLLYTKCTYIYPSGNQCTNPVPKYLDPLLCGGHCDNIRPPDCGVEGGGDSIRGATTLGLGLGQDRLTSTSETQGDLEAIEASGEKEAKAETSLNL